MSLFDRLKKNNSNASGKYDFQGGGSHPLRERPGVPSSTKRQNATTPARPVVKRMEDGDRPPAYQPPAVYEEGVVVDWEPPTFGEMLKDLGLRMFEVGAGAALEAMGREAAWFFQSRRVFTREQRKRREWE